MPFMRKTKTTLKWVGNSCWWLFKACFTLFAAFLPSLILIALIQHGVIYLPEPNIVPVVSHKQHVHDILPHTRWEHMKPCGTLFDERIEFQKALSCVNEKVWPNSPIPNNKNTVAPRCFLVSTSSPDVAGDEEGFNFIPMMTPMGIAAIVGIYDPDTHTVFVVENVDAPMVYRHELQHRFLHMHDPITEGGGHYQDIWKKCEPPYYESSERSKIIGRLIDE